MGVEKGAETVTPQGKRFLKLPFPFLPHCAAQ